MTPQREVEKRARRLTQAWDQATPDQRRAGELWYRVAWEVSIEGMARKLGRAPREVAAAVAILSPGTRWETSLEAARRIFSGARRPFGVYRANWVKARLLARGKATIGQALGNGPKVRAFYCCIVHGGRCGVPVVDRHMVNAMAGERRPIRESQFRRPATYQDAARPIVLAANRLGVPVSTFQATVWLVEKGRIHESPAV